MTTLYKLREWIDKTKQCTFVNRDVNACKNILLIAKTFFN
jgi:hypothetical protein